MPTAALLAAVVCSPMPDTHPHCAVRRLNVVTAPEVFAERLVAYGFELYAENKPSDALAAFDAARCLSPDRSTIPWSRALALAALGRHDEAADEYERMLSFDPTNPYLWQNVAFGWVERGKFGEAEACFAEARRWCATDAERFELDVGEAMSWAGGAPREHKTRRLNRFPFTQEATGGQLGLVPADRLVRAEAALTHAIALNNSGGKHNSVANAYHGRGVVRFHLGRTAEAQWDADQALSVSPSNPVCHLLRASLAQRRGDRAVALEHLDLAARFGADPATVAGCRCAVFTDAGEVAKAEEAAREWCRLDPQGVNALRVHGALLRLSGKDDEADRAAERVAELTGSSVVKPFIDQAQILLGQFGQFEHRESAFRTYARLLARPHLTRFQYLDVLTRRADLWRFLGQQMEAFDDLTTAVRLAPENPHYRLLRLTAADSLQREREVLEDAAAMRRLRPMVAEVTAVWRRVSGPEELRAAMAGREPDYRPAGPVVAVPITVSAPRVFVAGLGERKRGDVR